MDLPTGTVTFLFTDVEGSTRLAEALGASRYSELLDAHRQLLRDAFRASGGIEVDCQGDGFFVAFPSASEATRAGAAAQQALAAYRWPENAPVRVRVGIHTGEAAVVDGSYRGLAVHRAARICSSAHGGQILLSSTTRDLVETDLPADVRLRELGPAQLRDIERPEQLFQLVVEGLPEAFPPPRAQAARQLPDRGELLEREGELAALEAVIAAAPAGGRLLAIEGPAGIGKTRLVAEARAHAQEAGMHVLSARGSELEQEFSYGAVRQLFEPLLATATPEEHDELLAGAAALAMPIFDPAHLNAEANGGSSPAMLHGLFWLTANLASRQALLLVIDDLHWCDPPSLRWLAYLLPRIEGLPLLVVVGLRPGEPHADEALLDRITADPVATVVRPDPLSAEASGTLVRQILTSELDVTFQAAVHDASGGNPLLVRELARAVAAEGLEPTAANAARVGDLGGEAVSRAVSSRLARLSPEAKRLAGAVAVLGDDADPRHGAALAGLDEAVAAVAADDLGRVEILRRDVPLAFVHPVVRSAVYAELPAVERDGAHRRAAALLAESGAPSERVAAQLLLATARGDAWAVSVLRDAARAAIARGAPESAVAYLRRALDDSPEETTGDVLHELGSAEARTGAPDALEHLAAAYSATTDIRSRARIGLELARAQFAVGEPPRKAAEVLQQAIRELPAADDSGLALELETKLIGIARLDPELHPLAAERLERLRASLPQLSSGHDVVLANLASEATLSGVGSTEAVELAERALASGSLLKEHYDPEFIFAVDALTAADRLDASHRLHSDAMEDAGKRGLAIQYCLSSRTRSAIALLRGALSDAVADAELCLDAIDSNGLEFLRPGAVGYLARALIERGELTRARESLASVSLPGDPNETTTVMYLAFFDARARLRRVEGAYAEAVHELVSQGENADRFGLRNPALFAWRSQAALALLGLGRAEEARRYAAKELELSREWGAPRALGRSLIAAGLAEGGDAGIALLREAVAVLEPSEVRLEHARALVELGAALRRGNHRADSRYPLRRALELATHCGAAPLAERAETELLATGARPRRVALSGVDSLTPSERRVAEMAAEGGTNREIAQALFVTPKTVEVHLSSTYRKLDISSRSQLSRALDRSAEVAQIAP